MMLQDLTIEHTEPEVIALALRQAIDWGARLDGYFLCPTPPVIPHDEYPAHTLAQYRRHRGQAVLNPGQPISGHIAAVGTCACLGRAPTHERYVTTVALCDAALENLRAADLAEFLRAAGHDGPFHGTDALVRVGYRLHYCSWHGSGIWLSFRHVYIGK